MIEMKGVCVFFSLTDSNGHLASHWQQTAIKGPPWVKHRDSEINETQLLSSKSWGQADWEAVIKKLLQKALAGSMEDGWTSLSLEGEQSPTHY